MPRDCCCHPALIWKAARSRGLSLPGGEAHLALDERAQEHEDGDAGPHDEVEEVPQGQAADLPQGHLLHLETQPVPLAAKLPLKADENHLQRFTPGKETSEPADLCFGGTLPTSSCPHPQPLYASNF